MHVIVTFSYEKEILDAIYLNAVDDETQLSAERLEMIEENLTECISNKIDLNNEADLDRLEMLPFISAQQADNIRIYVHSHGPLRSFYELMLVDGLFRQDILNLLPFVRLDFENEKQRKVRFGKMLQGADHELILRTDRTLEKKRVIAQILQRVIWAMNNMGQYDTACAMRTVFL